MSSVPNWPHSLHFFQYNAKQFKMQQNHLSKQLITLGFTHALRNNGPFKRWLTEWPHIA